jgi:hypothetical protein
MRKVLIASAAAVALLASSAMSNDAKAWGTGADCSFVCIEQPATLVGPAALVGAFALGAYLILNANAPAGSLAAAPPDENMLQFQANAARWAPQPAYAFIETNANVAAVK